MIHIFYRKKRKSCNSIEMVFGGIKESLMENIVFYLPMGHVNPITILTNIFYAKRHQGKVNHITGDVHYIALGLGHNTILTVHDIGSSLKGGWLKKKIIEYLWFRLPARRVTYITVISEFTKRELSALIPKYAHKIVVIHNAFNPQMSYIPKIFNDVCPTILHMGTKENKNLERTIEALKGISCHLNVVGKLNDKQRQLLDDSGISYENHYDVAYSKIVEFYQNCDVVSFPSTYEGFGVPILEANAAGRPIIAGDIEVLHEVAENAACFVDPYSIESIRIGFERVIEDGAYRQSLVEKGLWNIKRFAPEVIAEKYNRLYKEIGQ